ncbi:MAG: NUDIX hydrolase [Verrucomicrobiales bacterium]
MDSQLINAYRFCPICGSANYILKSSVRQCGDCGHSDFNSPITAVAVWVFDREGRVFLIRRAKDPGRGKFAPPGGFVDAGESLEAAARREVLEEVGLKLEALDYLSSGSNLYSYQGLARPVCDVFFMARAASFDVVLERGEVCDGSFQSLTEIQPEFLAFESMRESFKALCFSPQKESGGK